MSDLTAAVQAMTDAIAEQNTAIFHLEKKVDKQNERLNEFVPRGKFRAAIASLTLSGLLVLGFAIWARAERQQENVAQKVAGATRAYANCESTNRVFDAVDKGYISLAEQSLARATDDEMRERTKESLRRLRSGLNRTDCAGHLVNLSPEDAEKVKDEAARRLPLLPLPSTPFD